MARSPDLLVAQIGITKAGAAWLPFDAEAPADRVAVCLKDAEAKALVTSAALKDKAPTEACPALTPTRSPRRRAARRRTCAPPASPPSTRPT